MDFWFILTVFGVVLALVILVPLAFDLGFKCGRKSAIHEVTEEIPGSLTLEQMEWLTKRKKAKV
jgi:hypothetical protein